MPELHFPWLETAILVPLLGAVALKLVHNSRLAFGLTVVVSFTSFVLSLGEWIDFSYLGTFEAHDHWDIFSMLFRKEVFVVDELSAPLLPLGSLIFLVTILSTSRSKAQRFSFSLTLVSLSILLGILSCHASWTLVALLCASTIPPYIELKRRGRCTRVYFLHMALSCVLMLAGFGLSQWRTDLTQPALLAGALLTGATLLRSGIVPVHCWMTDLFEKATFGTSLLFATPLVGPYAVMRLVLPIAPDWALHWIAILSLVTAVYAAGMSLVQSEARRFFCYLFLSNASLVLVGLELVTPIGMTGALCVWLSVGLSLTGFGITLRCIESRIGRVSLKDFHGLFEHMPTFAGFFLLTGLASIGFPGTIGFIAIELLVDGAVGVYPVIGALVVLAAALNGIAVVMCYFRIFTGRRLTVTSSLAARPAERFAILLLSFLIIAGGMVPQPGVASRYHAAVELAKHREGK